MTLALRPLLFMYRVFKGKNSGNPDYPMDYYVGDLLKKKNGFVWGIRYLALAYERYKLAHIAYELASRGAIVICDRYPTLSPGKMDSPRIDSGGSRLVEIMSQYERQFYQRLPKANGLIFLDVSIEEAIKRNRSRIKKDKETDNEIKFRHKENQELIYSANKVFFVDADRDYDSVLNGVKSIAWECLLVANKV